MEPVVIRGRPALLLTQGEREWKDKVRAVAPTGLTRPRLAFSVESLTRRGHAFDIDNLASPLLPIVGGEVESVWVTVEVGDEPGVAISEQTPPTPPRVDYAVLIADPPTRSVRREEPVRELAGAGPLGSDEPLGLHLAFASPAARIADFKFEGPVKPLIDCLAPLLGGTLRSPHDHRIRDLRVVRGASDLSVGVVATLWLI